MNMTNILAAFSLAFAIIAGAGVARADEHQAPIATHKHFQNFGGDCYAQGDVRTINRCLVESTRGGGGAK